jgi:hypothetical protein
MGRTRCLAVACLLSALGAQAATELTEADFKEKVFNGKFSFVKFLAPW